MSEPSPRAEALEQRSRMLHKALRLLEAERGDLAAAELRRALAQFPEDAELHFHLARALVGSAPRRAIVEARRAVELDPEWAPPHNLLAALEMDAGRHSLAEELLLESLRLDPENACSFELYGQLMYKTGHLDKAEKLLHRALELDPELASAHSTLGVVLGARGRRQAAKAGARRGLALEPESADEHFRLGITYFETGHPFRARRHLREALRMDPDEDTEQVFLQADRCCRLVYLPMYYYSLLIQRLPGRQFALWGALMVLVLGLRALDLAASVTAPLVGAYLILCVYTWVAGPLVRGWVRLRPPR